LLLLLLLLLFLFFFLLPCLFFLLQCPAMPNLRSRQIPPPPLPTKTKNPLTPKPATPARSREPTVGPDTPSPEPTRRRSTRLASKSAPTPNRSHEEETAVNGVCSTEKEEEEGNGKFGSEDNVIDEMGEGVADVGVDDDGDGDLSGVLSLRSGKRVGKRKLVEKGGESQAKRKKKLVLEVKTVFEEVGKGKKLVVEEEGAVDDEKLNGGVGGSGGWCGRRKRVRYSREEKGKQVVVDESPVSGWNGGVKAELESEVKDLVEGLAKSVKLEARDENTGNKDLHLKEGKRERDGNARKLDSRMEQFRDIARQNAYRFAHFEAEEQDGDDGLSPVAGEEVASREEEEEKVEDWPGPFSSAMKIIRDRANKLSSQQGAPTLEKNQSVPVMWIPKGRDRPRRSVPSLEELALKILVSNADAITSLETVPDALRHKLCRLLCDSRRMNSHVLDLLVCGSPLEIRLKDCSWLSEEAFTKCFESCDTTNLRVLQIDQSGRCLPDYVLPNTLARSSGSLPALTTLSIRGACRLSDVGLECLVSSAPALQSINLSQCSLLSPSSLDTVAGSLGSVLRELYIDDCQSIDAMLILPSLKRFEHLEVLSLRRIQTVCDEFVKEFVVTRGHKMKELVFSDCVKLTDLSVKVIAESCSGLRALDLCNLRKLTDSALGYLANGCPGIHSLRLCRNAFSDEAIAAFVETAGELLKDFSLNNVKKVGNSTALSIAKRSRNLTYLDLSFCRNLTNEALGLIVDSCPLKVLKVFGCSQITKVLLDGHSNTDVKILGSTVSQLLESVGVSDVEEYPLRYS
ncbi:hypothetical protein Tsubulata_035454, partial [Turnera subulata]